tara:strand:+ start:6527 stop:9322 length:2796 start_codon:yes stop_codon:yes gene_type:complete
MTVSDLIMQVRRLFIHRDDTYAKQNSDGSYSRIKSQLDDGVLALHLRNKITILSYTVALENTCRYVCWDIDEEGDLPLAQKQTLKLLDTMAQSNVGDVYIEFSGLKGYHIYRFCPTDTPASKAKEFGERVLLAAKMDCEVFPKQTDLNGGRVFGNGIKLPFSKHQKAAALKVKDPISKFVKVEDVDKKRLLLPYSKEEALALLAGATQEPLDFSKLPKLKKKVANAPATGKGAAPTTARRRQKFPVGVIESIISSVCIDTIDPSLNRGGGGRNPCPVCWSDGKTPSLSVSDDGLVFKCHRCSNTDNNAQGDAITFIQFTKHYDRTAAITHLYNTYIKKKDRPKVAGAPQLKIQLDDSGSDRPVSIIAAEEIREHWNVVTIPEIGRTYIYTDGRYLHDPKCSRIRHRGANLLGDHYTTSRMMNVTEQIKDLTMHHHDEFSNKAHFLNVKNGILDLRSQRLMPHTPDFLTFEMIPVEYDVAADCPKWMEFLAQSVPMVENQRTLQEFVGYCLYKKNHLQKCLVVTGTGANGKSVFLNTIKSMFGMENTTSVSKQDMSRDPQRILEFADKLVNIVPDSPANDIVSTDVFKRAVSGDSIAVRRLYHSEVTQFTPFCKHMFAANKLGMPKFDDSDAYFRRFLVVPFPVQFVGEDDNPNLLAELESELAGILNWAIDGLTAIKIQGGFTDNKSITELRLLYEANMEPTFFYAREHLEELPNSKISKDELYGHYLNWCKDRGVASTSNIVFGRNLKRALPSMTTGKMGGRGKRVNCHVNIGFTVGGETEYSEYVSGMPSFIPDTIPDTSPIDEVSGQVGETNGVTASIENNQTKLTDPQSVRDVSGMNPNKNIASLSSENIQKCPSVPDVLPLRAKESVNEDTEMDKGNTKTKDIEKNLEPSRTRPYYMADFTDEELERVRPLHPLHPEYVPPEERDE